MPLSFKEEYQERHMLDPTQTDMTIPARLEIIKYMLLTLYPLCQHKVGDLERRLSVNIQIEILE